MAVKGLNEYVTGLYEHLRVAMENARITAAKEARRFKRNYDRRAGAAELRPGDKVLVRLDSYIGQRRKLKNRWGSDLHTVRRQVADDVPVYVVTSDKKPSEEKVLHRARLLLWIAVDTEDEGVRLNHTILGTEIASTGKEDRHEMCGKGAVSRIMVYGINLATFMPGKDPLDPMTGQVTEAACKGVLQDDWTSHGTAEVGNIGPTKTGDDLKPEDVPP